VSELATRRAGHPYVYGTSYGAWASLTWTRGADGSWVPQICTNHSSWHNAMARVRRWYASGKTVTW